MKIKLENIGLIKKSNIKFNGLTVIAGKNDTGKTTVGKSLFSAITHHLDKSEKIDNGITLDIEKKNDLEFPIFIDTPDFLSKFSYIKNTQVLLQQRKLYYYIDNKVIDLILRISQPNIKNITRANALFKKIRDIIDGEVYYDTKLDNIFYKKKYVAKTFNMSNTSNGIKMFGFLQILILNQSLKNGSVLILDEPEVHLHPIWQLKMAEIIVILVEKGVTILVNSHSPYMIEALQRYSHNKITSDFYLAEDGDICQIEKNNDLTLSKIFSVLSEPFAAFEEMDSEEFKND